MRGGVVASRNGVVVYRNNVAESRNNAAESRNDMAASGNEISPSDKMAASVIRSGEVENAGSAILFFPNYRSRTPVLFAERLISLIFSRQFSGSARIAFDNLHQTSQE